jgi:hypothetical protein
MNFFNIFIHYIIILKIIYLIVLCRVIFYKYQFKKNINRIDYYEKYKNSDIIESYLESVLMISIALLIMILFRPRIIDKDKPIDFHSKQILFLFSIVLIIQQIKKSIIIPDL